MAGYNGYSMSNNAVSAYECGEKPISKWTKTDLIEAYEKTCKEYNAVVYDLSKVKVSVLKYELLKRSSWHHTSSMFNKTDFYEIDIDFCLELNQEKVNEMELFKEEKKEETAVIEKWKVKFLTWSGTRKHPKATVNQEVVEYDRSKNYVLTSAGKKMINANGFELISKVID